MTLVRSSINCAFYGLNTNPEPEPENSYGSATLDTVVKDMSVLGPVLRIRDVLIQIRIR
jgi:hypothetical protein